MNKDWRKHFTFTPNIPSLQKFFNPTPSINTNTDSMEPFSHFVFSFPWNYYATSIGYHFIDSRRAQKTPKMVIKKAHKLQGIFQWIKIYYLTPPDVYTCSTCWYESFPSPSTDQWSESFSYSAFHAKTITPTEQDPPYHTQGEIDINPCREPLPLGIYCIRAPSRDFSTQTNADFSNLYMSTIYSWNI